MDKNWVDPLATPLFMCLNVILTCLQQVYKWLSKNHKGCLTVGRTANKGQTKGLHLCYTVGISDTTAALS